MTNTAPQSAPNSAPAAPAIRVRGTRDVTSNDVTTTMTTGAKAPACSTARAASDAFGMDAVAAVTAKATMSPTRAAKRTGAGERVRAPEMSVPGP